MAIFRGSVVSRVLECECSLQVIVPWDLYDFKNNSHHPRIEKTVILLHGLRQNADDWVRYTNIARYANELGYAVVIPDLQRSFCLDMAHGPKYFTFINEELPQIIDALFKLPTDKDHLYIAGLSMGGYGSIKSALTFPDKYTGAICLSSALYLLNRPEQCLGKAAAYAKNELQGVIGMDLKTGPQDDVRALARSASESKYKPCIYMACGDCDGNHNENREMSEYLCALGIPSHFDSIAGGHYWDVWDKGIHLGLQYMNSHY